MSQENGKEEVHLGLPCGRQKVPHQEAGFLRGRLFEPDWMAVEVILIAGRELVVDLLQVLPAVLVQHVSGRHHAVRVAGSGGRVRRSRQPYPGPGLVTNPILLC